MWEKPKHTFLKEKGGYVRENEQGVKINCIHKIYFIHMYVKDSKWNFSIPWSCGPGVEFCIPIPLLRFSGEYMNITGALLKHAFIKVSLKLVWNFILIKLTVRSNLSQILVVLESFFYIKDFEDFGKGRRSGLKISERTVNNSRFFT